MDLPEIPLFLDDSGAPTFISELEVRVRFRDVDRHIDVAEIRLISHDDTRPITAEVWRNVRIGQVIDHARSGLSVFVNLAKRGGFGPADELVRISKEAVKRPGRPRDLENHVDLREVADVYIAARRTRPKRARIAVAEHFIAKDPEKYAGIDQRDNHTVKSWIAAATNRGFIPEKAS
jgi:hypothetical protein